MLISNFSECSGLSTILFSLLFIVTSISCEKASPPLQEIIIKDGLIYKQGELKPFTGAIKNTVDGKIIEYDVVEGKKSGEFKTYFRNGQLEMIGQIKENFNQGKWTYYYQNGQVESEGIFKDDLPDGKWKWFYENGILKEEGIYFEGNREGLWIIYDMNGKITEEKFFKENLVQENK